MPQKFIKDPDEVLDYVVNWATWLGGTDTIVTSTWVMPTGITKDSQSNTTTTATIWLSGGTAGTEYTITNRIVTDDDRTADRSIKIKVQAR